MMDDRSELQRRISALLLRSDPMRIYFKDFDNQDEYDSEAEDLARRLPSCTSRGACLEAVHRVLEKYFGDLIASRAIDFEALADGLWELRRGLPETPASTPPTE